VKSAFAWVGIDIGLDGALVSIDLQGRIELHIAPVIDPIPVKGKKGKGKRQPDEVEMRRLLHHVKFSYGNCLIGLESAAGMPGQSSVAVCTFCTNYGLWRGMLAAMELPFFAFRSQEWQKQMFKGIPKGHPKAMARQAAGQLYPSLDLRKSERAKKPHEGLVDALLIARYMMNEFPFQAQEAETRVKRQKQ
jgi:hypothetical protein